MPAMQIRRDHIVERITVTHDFGLRQFDGVVGELETVIEPQFPVRTFVVDETKRDADELHGIEPVATIEQRIFPPADDVPRLDQLGEEYDRAGEAVFPNVLAKLTQLSLRH
jgi:hypothetical protein